MMAIIQTSFQNSAASLLSGKLHGSIVDVLMPPLSASEFTLGYVLGGATRGVMVGAVIVVLMQPFVTMLPQHPAAVLFYSGRNNKRGSQLQNFTDVFVTTIYTMFLTRLIQNYGFYIYF